MKSERVVLNLFFSALAACLIAWTEDVSAQAPVACESARLILVGKYAVCMAKAENSLLDGNDVAVRKDPSRRCITAHLRRWKRLENPTANAPAVCPTPLEPGPFQDLVDRCTLLSATAIEREGRIPATPTCADEVAACDPGNAVTSAPSASRAAVDLGNAVPDQVLEGWMFSSNVAGIGAVGTMPHRRSMTLLPAATDVPIPPGFHDGTGKCAGDADLLPEYIKSGVNVFGVLGTLPHSRSLRTGQTGCYSDSGSLQNCTGSLQDGALRRGTDRAFADLGNGAIKDEKTGLTWEKLANDGGIHDVDNRYPFAEAIAVKIAALNTARFGGYSDWRLPNRLELESLVHLGRTFPSTVDPFNSVSGVVGSCPTGCTVTSCSCTHPRGLYWTSTTYVHQPDAAWLVYFGNGGVGGDLKSKGNYVRAVRG